MSIGHRHVTQSQLLMKYGLSHGFSLGTLDFSPNQDAKVLKENMHELALAVSGSVEPPPVVTVSQVHGQVVREINEGEKLARPWTPIDAQADAIITNRSDCLVAVRTADCLPILVASKAGDVVAAIHAGWRGVDCGMIEAGIKSGINSFQWRPADLIAAIGPAISVKHFEVGEEVLAQMSGNLGNKLVFEQEAGKKPHIDLKMTAKNILLDCGLAKENVDILPHCTYADENLFSYRRQGKASGRLLGAVKAHDG